MAPQRSLLALFASVSFVASVFGAPSGEPLDSGAVFGKVRSAKRGVEYHNEHHEQYRRNDNETLVTRAMDPNIKRQLDAVMGQTASLKHFFWTGRMLPATQDSDSVMDPAGRMAKSMGGTTLEETIKNVPMPTFQQRDPDSIATWEYASEQFASYAKGDAYLIHGDTTRPDNVWVTFEFPRLKKGGKVKRIFRIDMHTGAKTDPMYQIWPECIDLEDKTPSCPAGSKLYHGSASKPQITAKTTVAKDGKAVVAATGNAAGITRECNQLIDGKMVKDLMQKAGTCTADAKVNQQLKTLLSSAKNRQYVQKARIATMVKDLESDVVNAMKFKSSPLDGLVAIDYYERTLADSNSVASQIDTLLKTATGTSPGIANAWAAKINKIKPIKATLLALVQQEIAAKAKQAAANQKRNAACGGSKLFAAPSRRMERRFSPFPRSSLEARVVKAPRAGAKAPAAPACPLKSAPPKKTVPRSQAKTKAPPAKKPRTPAKAPARKPANTKKKVATRPANRARRTPGKATPRKRATPKRKPKVVPKPTRRPKGKPRSRKRKGRK